MTAYLMRPLEVDARRLSATDADGVTRWAGARLRGTLLPADEQFIQWDGPDGEEEARVGDWLVRLPNGRLVKHSNEEFELLYWARDDASPLGPFGSNETTRLADAEAAIERVRTLCDDTDDTVVTQTDGVHVPVYLVLAALAQPKARGIVGDEEGNEE